LSVKYLTAWTKKEGHISKTDELLWITIKCATFKFAVSAGIKTALNVDISNIKGPVSWLEKGDFLDDISNYLLLVALLNPFLFAIQWPSA
jgi:hypothetical protein